MRRVFALIAAMLFALAIAGPVAAAPTPRPDFPTVYEVTCADGTVVPDQYAKNGDLPGWDILWAPGDKPWLLMGYTIDIPGVGSFTKPLPAGLVGDGKLVGPCEVTTAGETWVIGNAYFLHR